MSAQVNTRNLNQQNACSSIINKNEVEIDDDSSMDTDDGTDSSFLYLIK